MQRRAYLEAFVAGERRIFPVRENTACRIGRDPQCTVVLTGGSVSRRHAMVQSTEDGQFLLTDLGSRNGTLLNGHTITGTVQLTNYDRILIGETELLFFCEASDAERESTHTSESTQAQIQEMLMTAVVVDLRDFTGLQQREPGAVVSDLISAFTREAGSVFRRRRSMMEKYLGDAVMGLWAHSGEQPLWAEMLPIFQALAETSAIVGSLHARFGLDRPMRAGAGINTGMAVTGNLGSKTFADHTALGDAITKAFRLEAATKETDGDVALGASTFQFLSTSAELPICFRPHLVRLKGFPSAERIFVTEWVSLPSIVQVIERETDRARGATTARLTHL